MLLCCKDATELRLEILIVDNQSAYFLPFYQDGEFVSFVNIDVYHRQE